MKRIRNLGLALVALLATSGIAVASATAAFPEFSGTIPTNIVEKTYTQLAELETKKGTKVVCQKFTVKGKLTGATELESTITFKECTAFGFAKCTSAGAGAGEIVVPAGGEPVYLNEVSKTVAIRAIPKKANNEYVEFTCTAIGINNTIKVRANAANGGLLCQIKPVNTATKNYELICKKGAGAGENEFTEYEKGGLKTRSFLESKLNAEEWEQAAEIITGAVKFEFESSETLKA
jgi:hypothetical protein